MIPKFRAWNVRRFMKDNEFAITGDGSLIFLVDKEDSEYMKMEWLDVKVTRSTGLDDVNGTPIFEGDIINFTEFDINGSDTQHVGVVKFVNCEFQIWRTVEDEFWGSDGAFYLYGVHQQDEELRVIGNYFENKELLK